MFDELVKLLNDAGQKNREISVEAGMLIFGERLRSYPEIRIYVEAASGLGHQAASVHVMRRLITMFSYEGKVTIVYREGNVEKTGLTVDKLALLLPGFDPDDPERIFDYDGATLTALPWERRAALNGRVPIAFTGGADTADNLATQLEAAYFLRLQPYFWIGPQQVERFEKPAVDLDEIFGSTFERRAYKYEYPSVLPDEWEFYETNGPAALRQHTKLAHIIVDNIGDIRLCPVSGVRQRTETGQYPDETLAQIAVSLQAAKYEAGAYFGPNLVVCLEDDISTESFAFFNHILQGGLSRNETDYRNRMNQAIAVLEDSRFTGDRKAKQDFIAGVQALLRNAELRAKFLRKTFFDQGITLLVQPSESELRDVMSALQKQPNQTVVVQIGKVPPDIFAKLMAIARLPSFFEGQGTANLALTLGLPYIHLPRPNAVRNNYPAITLEYPYADRVADGMAIVAKAVTNGFSAEQDSFADSTRMLSQFIKGVYSPDDSPVRHYFEAVRAFYAVESNDKLVVALVFLIYYLAGRGLPQAGATRLAEPEPTLTLDELWVQLEDNLRDGVLNLVPGTLPSGPIADFYKSIAPSGVRIAGAELTKETGSDGAIARIIVSNGTTEAFGLPTAAVLDFTTPVGPIVCAARYESGERWTLLGMPWIVLDRAGFALKLIDTVYPAEGSIFATIANAGASLSLAFPAPDEAWLLSFRTAVPIGIETMFNLAGGVNLVNALPPQVAALGGFGAEGIDLSYRPAATSLASVQAFFGTARPWTIVEGRLSVENLKAAVAVVDPLGRTRKASGQVEGDIVIGSGEDRAIIRVGVFAPGTALSGELTAGILRIEDLLATFLPGVPLPLDAVPDITQFVFNYQSITGDYSVTCNLNVGWTVSIPSIPQIRLDGLSMSIQRAGAGAEGGVLASFTVGDDSEGEPLRIDLAATYLAESMGWEFGGKQVSSLISLADVVGRFLPEGWTFGESYNIRDVAFTIAPTPKTYTFHGATEGFWTVPFLPELKIAGDLTLAYSGVPTGAFAGRIHARIVFHFIDLDVYYQFRPQPEWGFTWGILSGNVLQNAEKQWVGTLLLGTTSIGAIVETMVSWATGSAYNLSSPWGFLNSITFNNLSLEFNFTTKQVSIVFALAIDVGFASLTEVRLTYDPTNKTGVGGGTHPPVAVQIEGRFFWQVGDPREPLAWDATRPETAPAPPGNGNKYIDLRLLALGQHVTIARLREAKTVQAAIGLMAQMKDPEPGKVPDVTFDAESAWLIGADFGVLRFGPEPPDSTAPSGYVLTLEIVFNDPYLYGLRLALAGDAAKIFKGLDFQIMYRQVNETVGVYQAEITLPDVMRHISIGAYALTLPVFGIAVYTNGDFQVDVGFPWNEDFSRSFTIEAIIYPGIPIIGSAGFYFGKLSSASTDRVPKAINGTFNPVLVFGLGMQIGFGKSIEYGLLKAGFSITAVGIIEGVLAKFNRYVDDAGSNASQLQGAYYFWLRGTFGIVGRLYGSVDFAIIKADVNVTLKLLLQLTYESYVSMSFTVIVSVEVSASVKIDVGLFSISISFSFSMRVKETFTVENGGKPPWITAGAESAGFLAKPELRVRGFRLPTTSVVDAFARKDRWKRLLGSPAGVQQLSGWLVPALTVAHDERDDTQDPKKQDACYVFMPLIETLPETGDAVSDAVMTAMLAATPDTSFERLAKMILRWAVAAGQTSDLTPDEVDALVVTQADLAFILETILVSTDADPVPIDPDDIETFLQRQFEVTLAVPPQTQGSVHATYFPIPPALRFVVPAYGTAYPGSDYVFGTYNSIDDAALVNLRRYFDDLAVQVKREMETGGLKTGASGGSLSMATWVQSDYFLLLTRQMVQAALDALRDFKYVLAGQSAHAIVDDINTAGRLSGLDAYSLDKLFAANPSHELNAGKSLTVGVTYAVAATESFAGIAADGFRSEVSPLDLVAANATNAALLRVGATIRYLDQTYVVVADDTLVDVAWHFKARFEDFLSGSPQLTAQTDLFNAGASMLVPLVNIQAQSDSTFASIAAMSAYGSAISPSILAMQNAGSPILRRGEKVTYRPSKSDYVIEADDTLADVAAALQVDLPHLFSGSDVLTQPRLLADVALIMIPSFAYETVTNDTLAAIALKFATPVQLFGLQTANGTVADLFATTGADGQPTPFLDVPHLAQYRVDAIISEVQRSLAIRQLSRLAARYSMHGLRLPTEGIVAKAKGIWVEGTAPNLALPPKAALYALTGQQIKLPVIDATTGEFTMTFKRDADPSWLRFGTGTNDVSFTVKPGSDDATRIAKVRAAAQSAPLDVALTRLGADAMYEHRLASYPLTTVFTWQSPSSVTLPYGPPLPAGQVPALRIWKLPDALIDLAAPRTPGKIRPRFDPFLATYDEATGGTAKTPIASYGYSTLVTFTVKRVPAIPNSPSTLTTYEIAGSGGGDVMLLERIVSEVGGKDAAFQQLILGYAPDAAGAAPRGVQTGAPTGITMSIAQVNLSTETRPDNGGVARADAAEPLGVINPPSEFIRLLWEASITRAGGFYLYYFDALGNRGLPTSIFNDRNEADVSLIVLWSAGTTPGTSNRISDYINALVTGDSIDTARSVVFAEAAPIEAPIAAAAALSLDIVAERTYSDIGDLAEKNASLRLRNGIKFAVNQGIYQAPPGSIALSSVVSRFGLQSVAELNAANPRWIGRGGLPDPLPYPLAIFLPKITLTAGTSASSGSLRDVAAYYGETYTALAADNGPVAGLFADDQEIAVTGGPRARHATVPAGVESITASRVVPPSVPTDPNDPGYASAFLLNTFSMLNQQVAENVFFSSSKMGLPAGPTVASADATRTNDKIRLPKTLVPGEDEWDYKLALPYPKFAIASPQTIPTLPPSSGDPYRGVGSILQVDFSWQDYYGNTIVTTLSSPAQGGNRPPMVTGYVDAVLALSQWPSIASAWNVTKPEAVPQLEIRLTFDPSHYDGLISARATGATTVQAIFTDALDPTSAASPARYRLDGDIIITSASLSSDGKTVTLLTDDPLQEHSYILTVTNIQGRRIGDEEPPLYSGTATFANPDDSERRSSSLRDNARKDLGIYTNLYYQLNDTNGVAIAVETSLLTGAVDLDDAQWTALLAWLFAGNESIDTFIAARAAGQGDAAAPSREHSIAIPLPTASLNTAQIFELSTTLVIRRTGGTVLENLQTTESIRSAATRLSAFVQNVDPLETDVTLGLTAFAREFEAALSVPTKYLLKVAAGIDREAVSTVRNGAALWAVRLGTDGIKEPIAYAIENAGKPAIFAPQPISNALQTRKGVPIYEYATGVGISTKVSRRVDFVDIDMDVWGQQLFASIDEVLTPEFTSATQIVSARIRPRRDFLREILDQKKLFAAAASLWMSPVYAGETTDPAHARATFYQELLSRLSNAYTTRAAIQFLATVNAKIVDRISSVPPRLFGNIIDDRSTGEPRSEITLTAPKLALATATDVSLAFLLVAADNVRQKGAIVPKVDLDLTYDVTDIEHQIAGVPGIEGYVASTWLGFLVPGETRPLTKDLGRFAVPIILRGFPTSPSMVAQAGEPSNPGSRVLDDITQWTYSFAYALPFHFPQDRVYCDVQFNIAETMSADAEFADAFPAIAEFVTVYPSVQKDLVGILTTIEAETDDGTTIDNAGIALDSFLDLLGRITSTLAGAPLSIRNLRSTIAGTESYRFFITEGTVEVADPTDPSQNVQALLVTVVGAPPSGMAAPIVYIERRTWTATLHQATAGAFSYVYVDSKTGAYLLAKDGQDVPDRTIELAEMDILQRQDAWSTVYVKRNEELVPGKPTAEPFVYQTPKVQFAAPLSPTIDSSTPIDVASIGSSTPSKTSLHDHLVTLFDALFAGVEQGSTDEVTIQAETRYSYRLTASLDPIALPIFMQAPLVVNVTAGGTLALSRMITNWAEAIELWFDTHTPRASQGKLEIDLTIMSNLTLQPMPLLRLHDLYLGVVDIVPPLTTT